MGKRQIHPAILVEIQCHHAHRRRQMFLRKINPGQFREFSFARIQVHAGALCPARNHQINRPVIIEVRADRAPVGSPPLQALFPRKHP